MLTAALTFFSRLFQFCNSNIVRRENITVEISIWLTNPSYILPDFLPQKPRAPGESQFWDRKLYDNPNGFLNVFSELDIEEDNRNGSLAPFSVYPTGLASELVTFPMVELVRAEPFLQASKIRAENCLKTAGPSLPEGWRSTLEFVNGMFKNPSWESNARETDGGNPITTVPSGIRLYPEYDSRTLYGFHYKGRDTSGFDRVQIANFAGAGKDGAEGDPAFRGGMLCIIHQVWLVAPDKHNIAIMSTSSDVDAWKGRFLNLIGTRSNDSLYVLIRNILSEEKHFSKIFSNYRAEIIDLDFRAHNGNAMYVFSFPRILTELSIVIEVLEVQLKVLRTLSLSDSQYKGIECTLRARLSSANELLASAQKVQRLYVQIFELERARQQIIITREMAAETKAQAELSRKTQAQNKSIIVFTIIATIFLPLSFFTSYFGMNTVDIRDTSLTQRGFWKYTGPISSVVVIGALAVAFRGKLWRGARRVIFDLESGEKKEV